MWLFKRKKKEIEEEKERTLLMARYTYDVWQKLFPNLTKEEWEEANCPDDIALFTKKSIEQVSCLGEHGFTDAIIATIDDDYIEWLDRNQQKSSPLTLKNYLISKVNDEAFWNNKLKQSKMTFTYNILGISFAMLLHDINGRISNYILPKEISEQITQYMKNIYHTSNVFVPGWILKNNVREKCEKDIKRCADLYWKDGMRVRFGKYMEQIYTQDEALDLFSPFTFIIPFVIKEEVQNAKIRFIYNNSDSNDQCDENTQTVKAVKWTKTQKVELWEMLANVYPQIVSIGENVVILS